MPDPARPDDPETVTVAGNRWNAKRTLRVRPHPEIDGFVLLTVYNRIGNHAYELSMTSAEAAALADALRAAPGRPPRA